MDFSKGECAIAAREDSSVWELFQATPVEQDMVDRAKALCDKCSIIQPCLMVNYESDAIIAGGLSPYERKIKRWKRVNKIGADNWRAVSKVVGGIFGTAE
jgi:hypothetical protein